MTPVPTTPLPQPSGLKSKIRKVFRTTSSPDRNFSLVSQLTSAALCASSPALPKPSPVVKSLLRPLSVPQLRYDVYQRNRNFRSHSILRNRIFYDCKLYDASLQNLRHLLEKLRVSKNHLDFSMPPLNHMLNNKFK